MLHLGWRFTPKEPGSGLGLRVEGLGCLEIHTTGTRERFRVEGLGSRVWGLDRLEINAQGAPKRCVFEVFRG